ncbi:LysE family translocator [Streptomyces sp. NPDC052036]|uniref:LysE family translocator n=1 Tax=Streptomyces sp. NPDC052036 TaxID=3155171 RepID=UPI00341F73D4
MIGRALAHARRAVLAAVLGNAVGGCVVVVAVALGLGTAVERSALVYNVVKFSGAAYLVFLGVKAIRAGRTTRQVADSTQSVPTGVGRMVWDRILVGATNPKSIVFLTAVLPQFVDRHRGHVVGQMLVLGLIGTLLALLCDGLWGLTAPTTRDWFGRSPRRLALAERAGGTALIGLGLKVAVMDRAN